MNNRHLGRVIESPTFTNYRWQKMKTLNIELRETKQQMEVSICKRKRKTESCFMAVIGFLALTTVFSVYSLSYRESWVSAEGDQEINPVISFHGSRLLLWHSGERSELKENSTTSNRSSHVSTKPCLEPSIKEFPKDLFSVKQLAHGAVVVHIFVSMYMFLALAFVCDDYFVPSLDCICENLHLSDDIAGATFMAAGSSAPELFTSLFGLFVTHGDVGTGAIVGSAVFNILVILALVSILAGQATKLTFLPLCRDSIAYCISIIALIGVMNNGYIEWFESVTLLILYICYLVMMKFSNKFHGFGSHRMDEEEGTGNVIPVQSEGIDDASGIDQNASYNCGSPSSYKLVPKAVRKLTWKDVGMMIMLDSQFPPATRFRAACHMVILRQEDEARGLVTNETNSQERNWEQNSENTGSHSITDIEVEVGPFTNRSNTIVTRVFRTISRPIVILLRYTIPDCKIDRWRRWYMGTFFVSIFWIALFSYIMVWMVTVIGFTFGIPDVIMGITFLAAGTSIPDAIASLIVARQGQGDMAVSNSIGSNVFDILIGLAFPWFIETSIVHPGSKVKVNSRGLKYSVLLLLGSVVITVLTIHVNKWTLNRKTGYIFLVVYLVFISFSSLIEFNVFGFVNLPACNFHW